MPKEKKSKMKPMPLPYIEGQMEEPKMKPMPHIMERPPYSEDAMEEPRMKPMPYYEDYGLEDESLKPGKEYRMKKGGMTKAQKKVGSVMKEFKAGKLHSGKKGPVVKNPKQAIAIALSEAGKSKPMKKRGGGEAIAGMGAALQEGGMVRGQGAAIRGTKFKGIF